MKFASHLLSVGVVLASVTCAAAATKPGYVLATVNLRAAPSRGTEILTKIPGGKSDPIRWLLAGMVRGHLEGKDRIRDPDGARSQRAYTDYIGAVGGAAAGLSAQGLCG